MKQLHGTNACRFLLVLWLGLLLASCGEAHQPPPPPAAVQPTVSALPQPAGSATPSVRATDATSAFPSNYPTPIPTAPTPLPSPTSTPLPTVISRVELVGSILYLAPDRQSIRRIRPDGSDEQLVLSVDPADGYIFWYLVNPTGDAFLYRINQDGQDLFYLFRDGHSQLLEAPKLFSYTWSPDGHRFAARLQQGSSAEMPAHTVYLYDLETGQSTMLPVNGTPSWFPDGESLLLIASRKVYDPYVSDETSADEMVRYDLTSGTSMTVTDLLNTWMPGYRSLTPGLGTSVFTQAWSLSLAQMHPDGEHIVFVGCQRNYLGASANGLRVWTIALNNGFPRLLPIDGRMSSVRFNPAGTHMAYASSFHRSACDQPEHIGVITTDLTRTTSGWPPLFRDLDHDDPALPEVNVAASGFDWSPASDQLVFAAHAYTCRNAVDMDIIRPDALYIWDVQTGDDHTIQTVPRQLVPGSQPTWLNAGVLAHPDLTPVPVPPSPTPHRQPDTDVWLHAVEFVDTQHGWLLAQQTRPLPGVMRLLATEDGGATWSERMMVDQRIDAMDMVSRREGWLIIDGILQRTQDGGVTWQAIPEMPKGSIWRLTAFDMQHIWLGDEHYKNIYHSADGGMTWEKLVQIPLMDTLGTFTFTSPTDGWLIYRKGQDFDRVVQHVLMRTADSGHTWTVVTQSAGQLGSLQARPTVRLTMRDDTTGWLAGGWYRNENAAFWQTRDGGQTWEQVRLPIAGAPRSVAFTDDLHGSALVQIEEENYMNTPVILLRTSDGGVTWEQRYP